MQERGARLQQQPMRLPSHDANGDTAPLYVFNTVGGQGFVVVAGDDCVDPVLGYTEKGSYDEDNMPENFRQWLQDMTDEMSLLVQLSPTTAAAAPSMTPSYHDAVAPLIRTQWNQGGASATGSIYNTLCPIVSGKHCITGCVATAAAQIMYYYRYPTFPTEPVPGYTVKGSSVDTSQPLPSITFQWDKMKSVYSNADAGTESEQAVSELMLYCGYAAHMDYGLSFSSASTTTVSAGMAAYFGYDPDTYRMVYRNYYTIAEWDSLIYSELAQGRPVLYSGSSLSSGHAFLCDGYDGQGLFHFNWGWGGHYDGYFRLGSTDPYRGNNKHDSGYVSDNYAVIGIQPYNSDKPANPNFDEWEEEIFEDTPAFVELYQTEDNNVGIVFSNKTDQPCSFGCGLGELLSDGTINLVDTTRAYLEDHTLEVGSGWIITFAIDDYELSTGTHILVPLCREKGQQEWKRCNPSTFSVEVSIDEAGQRSVIVHPIVSLHLDSFAKATSNQPGERQRFDVVVTNQGDNFYGRLYAMRSADDSWRYGNSVDLKILAGNTKRASFNSLRFDAPGTYHVRIMYYQLPSGFNTVELLDTTITIAESHLEVTDMALQGNQFTGSLKQVDATIFNEVGDYTLPLYLFASQTDVKGSVAYMSGTAIEEGQSEVVSFYFTPQQAGEWHLWVCTDLEGQNVIGQTTVNYEDPPTGEVHLKVKSSQVDIVDHQATLTLDILNDGETANYREIGTWLYEVADDGSRELLYSNPSADIEIQPQATYILQMTYDDLQYGHKYYLLTNFRTSYTGNYKYLSSHTFTVDDPSGIDELLISTPADDAYYTPSGLRLAGKPSVPGLYLHKGKKMIIHL